MRVVTADPRALPSARRLVDRELAHVELAASRGRRDAEVATLPTGKRAGSAARCRRSSRPRCARHGHRRRGRPDAGASAAPVGTTATWRDIDLDETHHTVLVPRGLELDLDVVARAWAADRCAAVVADVLGVGVLVSLGGDIATAGPAGGGAWEVLVGDGPAGSGALVAVPTGLAVVTSQTATAAPSGRPPWSPRAASAPPRTGQPRSPAGPGSNGCWGRACRVGSSASTAPCRTPGAGRRTASWLTGS